MGGERGGDGNMVIELYPNPHLWSGQSQFGPLLDDSFADTDLSSPIGQL